MITVLLLGALVSVGSIEKGDAIVAAQIELLKLSFFCDDPLYRSKRNRVIETIAELKGVTSFSEKTVTALDDALKNKTVRLATPINRGDCMALISEAQEAVDALYGPAAK
ncbi:hypothetical protein PMI41_01417 [Phyllobacterium sp. YR531]|nr:hypothetical protein PMI41_01417 [Phyllobacterium sp. YR531]